MQKIKYIIIFTLTLGLGILYIQLLDYQKITTILLNENSHSNTLSKDLEKELSLLTQKNTQLENRIIFLEESLAIKQIQLNNLNFRTEHKPATNYTQDSSQLIIPQEKQQTLSPDVKPNITLDDENKVTGFGLEYQQNF